MSKYETYQRSRYWLDKDFDPGDDTFLGAVNSDKSKERCTEVLVNGTVPLSFLIDTGGDVSVMPCAIYNS